MNQEGLFNEDDLQFTPRGWVLSLWQPWATLWAIGAKRIETRDWQTSYRGPIYVHATRSVPRDYREEAEELKQSDLVQDALKDYGIGRIDGWESPFPQGAILGQTTLLDCRSTNIPSAWEIMGIELPLPPRLGTPERAFGNFAPDRWMWLTENAQPFAQPIPARGHQKMWTWQREVQSQ